MTKNLRNTANKELVPLRPHWRYSTSVK